MRTDTPRLHRRHRVLPAHIDVSAAALGALASSVVINPLELAKTRVQLRQAPTPAGSFRGAQPSAPTGFRTALVGIVRYEGFRGLQQGLAPYSMFMLAVTGVRIGMYRPVQDLIRSVVARVGGPDTSRGDPLPTHVDLGINVAASTCTGMLAGLLGTPLLLVKTRAHTASGGRSVHMFKELWAAMEAPATQSQPPKPAGGAGGSGSGRVGGGSAHVRGRHVKYLFQGYGACMARVVAGNVSHLVWYDWATSQVLRAVGWCRQRCEDSQPNGLVSWFAAQPDRGLVVQLLASSSSSVAITTACSPVDVVISRLYAHGAKQYRNGWECLVSTVKAEGVAALFRGWVGLYIRIAPAAVMLTMMWEQCREVLASCVE